MNTLGLSTNIQVCCAVKEEMRSETIPIQKISTHIEEIKRYIQNRDLHSDTLYCNQVTYSIDHKEDRLIAHLRSHVWEVASNGISKTFTFSLRKGMLYEPVSGILHVLAWIKAIGMMVKFLIGNIIVKIVIPLFYLIAQVFQQGDSLDDTFKCKRAWIHLTPLRALLGLLIHPLLLTCALIPGFSSFFNRLSGDFERFENGHTISDVRAKSIGQRMHEAIYLAPCQQPVGALVKSPSNIDEVSLTGDLVPKKMQRIFLRCIIEGQYRPSSIPTIIEA